MKRFAMTVAATLVSAAFSSTVLAQDKPTAPADSPNAGKKVQAPKKADVQSQGQNPSSENMDSNTQRQHSRSTPAASGNPSAQRTGQQQVQAGDVRDWGAIDKNKDHLVSPEEMEAYLQQGKKQ